jgi:hypothetical protein
MDWDELNRCMCVLIDKEGERKGAVSCKRRYRGTVTQAVWKNEICARYGKYRSKNAQWKKTQLPMGI